MKEKKGPLTVLWPQFTARKEKAVLIGLHLPGKERREIEDSLEELRQLALTAGAGVEHIEITRKDKPNPKYYIGQGKAEELARVCQTKNYDLVIFDDDLVPAQVKNLQELLQVKVLDRTELILDIFAIHARSREGKIQVELAQLQYMLPRLAHAWTHLSRQWGGMGTRGPGERQLELDRRRVRLQITRLSGELRRVHGHRHLQRKRRERIGLPLVAVIGYTNAGKTTLFNKITKTSLLVADKLFTTLDAKLQRLVLPNRQIVLFSDTVGFIKKLPHHLVESFKATLEEVYEADLLLHVIDGSSRNTRERYEVVIGLLKEMNVWDKPIITAVNKQDLIDNNPKGFNYLLRTVPDSIAVSARDGAGIKGLISMIEAELNKLRRKITLFIPAGEMGVVSRIYNSGNIIKAEYTGAGVNLMVELPPANMGEFKKWIKDELV